MGHSTRGQLFQFERKQIRGSRSRAGLHLLEIFESCKNGDFSATTFLPKIFELEPSDELIMATFELLPFVAPRTILLEIAEPIRFLLRANGYALEKFCMALARSGLLQATEKSIAIYSTDIDIREEVGLPYYLSITLESAPGDVFAGPPVVPDSLDEFDEKSVEFDVRTYAKTVETKIVEVREAYSALQNCCFIYGRPIDIESIALYLHNNVYSSHDNLDIVVCREIIEAYTGFDLSISYNNGKLNRSLAASALEELMDEVDLSSFNPGSRYFFGRKVPD